MLNALFFIFLLLSIPYGLGYANTRVSRILALLLVIVPPPLYMLFWINFAEAMSSSHGSAIEKFLRIWTEPESGVYSGLSLLIMLGGMVMIRDGRLSRESKEILKCKPSIRSEIRFRRSLLGGFVIGALGGQYFFGVFALIAVTLLFLFFSIPPVSASISKHAFPNASGEEIHADDNNVVESVSLEFRPKDEVESDPK